MADRWGTTRHQVARVLIVLAILAAPIALVTQVGSWQAVVAIFAWAMFVADGFVVMSLRVGARIYPRDQTGMIAGLGIGAWSAVLALLLPFWGRWFDQKMYAETFLMVSLMPLSGTLLWLALSRKKGMWLS